MSRSSFLTCGLTFVFLICTAAVNDRTELSTRHKKWIEQEVVYIVSAAERRTFRGLETDQARDDFIERFWAIRDPDTSTQSNEYREDHYRRIEYANQRFHDGRPGWRTDRGRIYIMHGPPDDISFVFGGDPLGVEIESPTETLAAAAIDRRKFIRMEFVRPETEIWVYRHLDGARTFPSYFEVMFSRADTNRLHQLTETIRRSGSGVNSSYAARVARDSAIMSFFNSQRVSGPVEILYAGEYKFPDIDSFYQTVFHPNRLPSFSQNDFQLAIRDLERSPGEILEEKLARKNRLKQSVQSRISFSEFSMGLSVGTIRAGKEATSVPITLGVDPQYQGDTLDLLLELEDGTGQSAASIVESVQVRGPKTEKARPEVFLYQSSLTARPGRYRLKIYGSLLKKQSFSYSEMPIELPDYSSRELSISDLLFFDRTVSRQPSLREVASEAFLGSSKPLYLRDYLLIPASDRRFRRRQQLTVVFEVYNPGLEDGATRPALDVDCRIFRGGQMITQVPSKFLEHLTVAKGQDEELPRTTFGMTIPLHSLHPGEYRLELELFDRVRNQSVSKGGTFTIY